MSNISELIASIKGVRGADNALSDLVKKITDYALAVEPEDLANLNPANVQTPVIAYDLWYLNSNANFMARYYDPTQGKPIAAPVAGYSNIDANHFDYKPYMAENLSFLSLLKGLPPFTDRFVKPLRVFRDLSHDLEINTALDIYSLTMKTEYKNNGIYWINTMAFELWTPGKVATYPSDGPKGYDPNNYVGYLSWPIGQLGAMEVISLMQETGLSGYKFTDLDNIPLDPLKPATVLKKLPVVLQNTDKPSLQSEPEIFPDMKDKDGNALAGQNYCYGRHLVESAYLVPTVPVPSQNFLNSTRETAYAPTPSMDVELFSKKIKDYEPVEPKFWMRYWIHKDSTLPVPGEFVGILCRPVACPPHVWWFQESSPFLYAGNWVETLNLTSGIITQIVLEKDREDNTPGNQYYVKIQGCEVIIESSDFFDDYQVGDRVAVLKLDSTLAAPTKSHAWIDQVTFKNTDKLKEPAAYLILPLTYYKTVH